MEKINLAKVSSETRNIIKQQTIALLNQHKKHKEIAEVLQISLQTVDRISSAYQKEGTACLKEKKSKFYGYLISCSNEEEILSSLNFIPTFA